MNPAFAVTVRRMTWLDLDRVIGIAACLKEAPHWPRAAYLAALDPGTAPRRTALVAELSASCAGALSPEPDAVAGFVVASLLPPQAELETIAVAPAVQRHGLAGRLFDALTAELRTARAEEILLEARASNQPALGLYRRLGFVETGRRSRYYHDPVEDAVLMRLEI